QAEDGIRDPLVTGVQTCALPILERPILAAVPPDGAAAELLRQTGVAVVAPPDDVAAIRAALEDLHARWAAGSLDRQPLSESWREIGRASCRERGEGVAGGARSER